jgi:hypothetical protein
MSWHPIAVDPGFPQLMSGYQGPLLELLEYFYGFDKAPLLAE